MKEQIDIRKNSPKIKWKECFPYYWKVFRNNLVENFSWGKFDK